MNFDDSQLSAFLDDELDPDDHLMVAWNVESSPATAQQLGDLKSVRDLVAGLDRPTIPCDLTAAILAEIHRPQPSRSRRLVRLGRIAAMIVGVGSLAASLLVAVVVLFRTHQDDPIALTLVTPVPAATEPRPDLIHPRSIAAAPSSIRPELGRPLAAIQQKAKATTRVKDREVVAAKPRARTGPVQTAARPEPTPAADLTRPAQVDAMLGQRQVLRALIVTDVLDRTTREVRSLIEADMTRAPDFGRITLTQGIVIDPDQPGAAEVYAVVLPSSRTDTFLKQLSRQFPEVQIETEPAPTLITQLTEVGHAEFFADKQSRLGLPPRDIRALVATKGAHAAEPVLPANLDANHPGEFQGDPLAVARQALLPAETSALAKQPATPLADLDVTPAPQGKPGPAETADEPVTVLVWVAHGPRR